MSLVDFTSDYKSVTPSYQPEPDPFPNYVEPTGSPTTSNFEAWGSPAPVGTPAPQPVYSPKPKDPTYNYTYDTWEDADGRLWDRGSGLWYSLSDPNNPLVYRPQVGWQSIPQLDDYSKTLTDLYGTKDSPGGFAGNPLLAQPSVFSPAPMTRQLTPAEWRQIQNYEDSKALIEAAPGIAEHDQYQYATREDNIARLVQGGYTRAEAEALPDTEAEARARLMDRVQYARDTGQGASLSDLLKPLGQVYSAFNKYVVNPIAETGAQLTPAALSLMKHELPGGGLLFAGADALTGYNPDERALPGLLDFGEALTESKGNPKSFADVQNENLAERPAWQQLAATTVYDPTNLLGVGAVSHALQGVEGGMLADAARALGRANEAIDVVQNKAGREALGFGAGALGNQLAGGQDTTGLNWWEAGALGALAGSTTRGTGSVGSKLAEGLAKFQGRSGLDPVLGLSLDIIKTPETRNVLDAVRKAGDNPGLAVELDAIRQAAGHDTVDDFVRAALTKGPEAKRLRTAILAAAEKEGVPLGGPIHKAADVTTGVIGKAAVPSLGATAGYFAAPDDASPLEKLAYALGGAGAAFGGEMAIDKVMPRLTKTAKPISLDLEKEAPIAVGLNRTEGLSTRAKIGNAIKNKLFLGHFSDDPRVAGIARDYELGRSRVPSQANVFAESVDARLKSVFDLDSEGRVKGLPYIDEHGAVVGENPDLQQIAAVLPHYLDKLTRPQLLALDYARAAVDHIASVRGAVDLDPVKAARGVIDGGFYLPRGKSVGEGVEEVTAIPVGHGKTGGEVSTEKARKFATKAEGEEAGRKYVPLVEALRNYASETLSKSWDHAAAQQLIETGLGIPPTAKLSPAVEAEIRAIRAEMAAASKRASDLNSRLSTERQIGRFTSRDLRAIDRRVEELKRQALDRTASMETRRTSAREASSLARTQLRDSITTALDAAEASGKADQKLNDVLARAQKQEARMASLEASLRDAAGLGEVRQPGVRLPAVEATGPNVDSMLHEASAATEAGRKINRDLRKALNEGLSLPVGTAATSATDSARAAVESARAARKSAQEALQRVQEEAKLAPDERIARIESEARVLARQYRDITERAQASGIRTEAIEDELDGIRQQQAVALAKIEGLKTAVSRAKNDAAIAREGKSQIDLVPLAGYSWPTSVANTFNKRIPRPGRKYLSVEVFDAANDTLRSLEATGDASAVGIQLSKLGFSHPALVAKATKDALLAMNDPGALGKYILGADQHAALNGEPLVETMAKYGVRFDTGEITTSAHGRTTITRAIENSPVLGKGVLEPSNRIFDNTGNFARIDLFKTLYRTWKSVGIDVDSPEVMKAIAKSTNMATGYSRNTVLGGPIGSRLLFAGRFFKSQIDTVADAVTKGGIEGTVARQQLARMIGIGSLITIAANEARGQETELRPWEPNFMRIRDVGGHDISVFGPWDSLIRGVISPDWNQAEHWRDFGRSKSGPLVSSVWDLWDGKTYVGEKATTSIKVGGKSIPAPSPAWAAEKVTPFGLANAIDEFTKAAKGEQSFGDAVAGAAAQFLGLKSSPLTGYERQLASMRDDWDSYSPDGYSKPKSMQDDPLFMRQWAVNHASKLAGPTTDVSKKLKEVDIEFKKKTEANDSAAMAGHGVGPEGKDIDWTIGDWKDRRRELQIEKRRALQDILGDKERKGAKQGTPAYWLQTYFDTFDKAETDLGLDFEALDKAQAQWLTENGGKALDYVNSYLQTGKSDIESDYLKAIAQMNKDGYFDMPKYSGMISGTPDAEIDRLRALVSEKSDDPQFAAYKNEDFALRAAAILSAHWKAEGKMADDVRGLYLDVINAGKKAHQNPKREIYKMKNPGLVEWLDNGNHYETLKAIAGD